MVGQQRLKLWFSDPLLLNDLVVSTILEFVDDDTLLTGRLVCQRWKSEITQRTGLWRRRCERLCGAHEPDKPFPPETDFFRVFLNLQKVLGRMACRESWQLDDDCDGSQCGVHKELARRCEWRRQVKWLNTIVPDIKYHLFFDKKIVICSRNGELIVLDEEKKAIAWRSEKLTTDILEKFNDSIFTVTQTGNLEVYSLNGKCESTDTGGQLQGVKSITVHLTAPFLLVLLSDSRVFLVNDKMHVFPIHLPPPPQPSQQQGSQAEPIGVLRFELNVGPSDDQLALAAVRKSSMSFTIFTPCGDILYHVFVMCDYITELSTPLGPGQGMYRLVSQNEGHVVAHALHFSSSGITVNQLWKKTLPARFCTDFGRPGILAGQKFLLCYEGTALRVYRMDGGALAAEFTFCLNGANRKGDCIVKTGSITRCIDETVNRLLFLEGRTLMETNGQRRPDTLHIVNYDWLDGLSPSAMSPDFPVAVIFSSRNPRGSSDPLLLDDLVVSTILEFVDDDTLLTGRLVCQRWKTEITQRTGLWRRRCEGLCGAHEPDKPFPPETDFFREFLNLQKVLGRMACRESWQLDYDCDGPQCGVHKLLARRCEWRRQVKWVNTIVPDIKYHLFFDKKIAICSRNGELIVLDEEKKAMAWRSEKLTTDILEKFNDSIFTVTQTGNLEVYSLNGKCESTDTGGQLQGLKSITVHLTAPFLLVLLSDSRVFLVNDKMQVFPINLPPPPAV
ncbi:hypothetical protein ACOMHN_042942 [Nucella lapillus]